MRIDQPRPELAARRVDHMVDPRLVHRAALADRRDAAIAHHQRIARQQRLVDVAGDDLPDVGDHQVVHRSTS
jgi:hypothetical protein